MEFRIVAVSLMPQRIVVIFSSHWPFSIFELNIPFNSHDTSFASWHIFKCHDTLWLFENSHNPTFRDMAVSLMPQSFVVFFPPNEYFRSLSVTYTIRKKSTAFEEMCYIQQCIRKQCFV
jgi:hypothetical protein